MWLDDARQDLRFAARMLVRSPAFAAVVILTMAISIGATATLFSLAYGVLMRPLPGRSPIASFASRRRAAARCRACPGRSPMPRIWPTRSSVSCLRALRSPIGRRRRGRG